MLYIDESQIDLDLNATLADDGIGFDLQLGWGEVTHVQVQLAAVDSAQTGEISLDAKATLDGVQVASIQYTFSEATDGASLSVLVKDPESGNNLASVNASSSANAGDSLSAHVYDPASGAEFVTIMGLDNSESTVFQALVKQPTGSDSGVGRLLSDSGVGRTLLNASASATKNGDFMDGSFTVKLYFDTEVELNGTVVDAYGTQDGFSLDAMLSSDGSTLGRADVDGTHNDDGLNAVVTVADGSSKQLLKLDPLVLVLKSTNYSLHATVFDGSSVEMVAASVALTNEPTIGQAQDVDINLFSPMDSSLNLTIALSMASALEGMEEVPCLQGSCSVDVGLQGQQMQLVFSSISPDQQEDYLAGVDLAATDTLYHAGASLTLQGVNAVAVDVQLGDGKSVISIDQFALSSSGTLLDFETEEKVLGWALDADVSASAQTIQLTVDGASGAMLEVDIANRELTTRDSSAGDVLLGGERVFKWDFLLEESGSTITLDVDVHDSAGVLAAVHATSSEDAVAGTWVSTANVSLRQDDKLETLGGVRLETVDSGARVAAGLQILGEDLQDPFLQLAAGVDFTAAGAARLLTDWEASVAAELRDPRDLAALLVSMSLNGTSSGGVFTTEMRMSGSKGAELIAWSTTGTSSSDSITTQGGIGSDTVVTLALSKPDGRLDTVTQMDSSVSIVGDGMSISVSMGYDGTDTWDMSGSLSENGDTAASIEAHLHEQWVSVASWVYEYGPLGDIGPLYMYANASIPSISDFSDMWEVHYFQTSDFIETANATWHMDTSVGEYSLAASSYTMEKDDGGEWRYTSSVNVTVDHIDTSAAPTPAPPMLSRKTVEGSFRATVAASEAQAFVSNADVEASFVASIAQRAGVPESMVQVTLSVVSSGGRRLSSGEVEILVTYAITAEVGASDDAGVISDTAFDSMVDTLASTSAEDFVVDFASELEATGSASSFSAVVAVPGSATAPMVTETSEKMSGAQAAFPQALLLAAICMLMV